MTRIALLGAESTGKTWLAQALAQHLRAGGHPAIAVPEVLREWCTAAGRAPRPDEQLAIAREQERRVDAAEVAGGVVIADTTALMVAIYAGMLYEDGELLRFALERQRGYTLTLVTGLDLPWVADGLQRDATQPREQTDALVRALLQRAGVPYRVVYGSGDARLQAALAALRAAGLAGSAAVRDEAPSSWTWSCEKCSDPDCEHRLFTGLLHPRG